MKRHRLSCTCNNNNSNNTNNNHVHESSCSASSSPPEMMTDTNDATCTLVDSARATFPGDIPTRNIPRRKYHYSHQQHQHHQHHDHQYDHNNNNSVNNVGGSIHPSNPMDHHHHDEQHHASNAAATTQTAGPNNIFEVPHFLKNNTGMNNTTMITFSNNYNDKKQTSDCTEGIIISSAIPNYNNSEANNNNKITSYQQNEGDDNECIPCMRFTKRQKKACTICKLPTSILSLVTRYLNKFDLFCVLSLTCRVFYNIVHNVTCWHDRMFAVCDQSLEHMTHTTFMTLVEQCQFRHLCIWQDGETNQNNNNNNNSRRGCISSLFNLGASVNKVLSREVFGTKSLCALFQCTKETIPFLRNLKTLVLKTKFATSKHIFLAMQTCPELETLTFIYDGTQSSPSTVKSFGTATMNAVEGALCDIRRTLAASTVKNSPIEQYAPKIALLKDKVKCRTLTHFKIIQNDPHLCPFMKQQLTVFTHLVLITQKNLKKIELSSQVSFLCCDTFVKYGNELSFDHLREIVLNGHTISNDALSALLSKCPNLSDLVLHNMPSLTTQSLAHLPSSLTSLCILNCPRIGVSSSDVTIPPLCNLTKLSFTSKLDTADENLIRSEALLVWKLFTSCDSAKLKDLMFNTHGIYNPYQVFCCNVVCDKLRNLSNICLMNSDLNADICSFISSNEHSDMTVAVIQDNSTALPNLPKCAVKSLSEKCKCLVVRSYTLPGDWLETFATNHTTTKSLQLMNCAVNYQPTVFPQNRPQNSCSTVEDLSLLSHCAFPLDFYTRIFSTFNCVKTLKLSELNPLPVYTLSIISQHCPMLESLFIDDCTYPVLSDQDAENFRVPLCSFENLKVLEVCNCSNPSLQQLCLLLLSMRNVEKICFNARTSSGMEIQHTPGGIQLSLVNNLNSGFFVQMKQIIQQVICCRKTSCLSMKTFWEWQLFVDVFRNVYHEIFEDHKVRVQTRLATPLLDPERFPFQELKSCLESWLTDDNAYIVLRQKPDRLASLGEIEQTKILEKFTADDLRIKQGAINKGFRVALPILFHYFMVCLVQA